MLLLPSAMGSKYSSIVVVSGFPEVKKFVDILKMNSDVNFVI
jgi:hypothetical protein